ncbi:phosphotransferase family protein [Rhizorhabdus argentea]|uniref:phosphotransferase family protein n=1 Tax=Rhizorhabdus argentea TaxID=1387174 RepID=UPI0030EC24B6
MRDAGKPDAMSMSQYLWSAAEALRLQVRPAIGENAPRDALDNSIRVLTAVANALDPASPVPVPAAFASAEQADCDRLNGPPENAAAHRQTGHAIARLAQEIDAGGDLSNDDSRAAIAWERAALLASVARYDAVERAEATQSGSDGSQIEPAALERYLRNWSGDTSLTIENFKLITGGRSRQTALFEISGSDSLPRGMVVQRGIPGQQVSSSFVGEATQFALLSMLYAAGMRVPRPILVEEDEAPLGARFLIVERSPGSPALTDYWGNVSSQQLVLDLAGEMAKLHSQPFDTLLGTLPVSRTDSSVAGWRADIDQLAAVWTSLAHWPSLTMSAAIAWLRSNADAPDDRQAIVHNDMVFHNILGQDGRITAVLDWEQANIGHPGEDLGYCYPYVSAVVDWDRFMQAYRDAGGPNIPQRQIDFFALRGGLRLMTLVLHGGRESFEKGLSNDVLVASAGAHFSQRLLNRIAGVLETVLARS